MARDRKFQLIRNSTVAHDRLGRSEFVPTLTRALEWTGMEPADANAHATEIIQHLRNPRELTTMLSGITPKDARGPPLVTGAVDGRLLVVPTDDGA